VSHARGTAQDCQVGVRYNSAARLADGRRPLADPRPRARPDAQGRDGAPQAGSDGSI